MFLKTSFYGNKEEKKGIPFALHFLITHTDKKIRKTVEGAKNGMRFLTMEALLKVTDYCKYSLIFPVNPVPI